MIFLSWIHAPGVFIVYYIFSIVLLFPKEKESFWVCFSESLRPTEWVSPLVVVPKADGNIQICVDMRRANSAIERERNSILTNEEVLYDLNGSTVFSKLNLKWGFHQVELDEKSRKITTFVTRRGLYQYKRLVFWIASASEKYQKIVAYVLQGCKGCGIEEHDRNLHDVLTRLKEKGLTLNWDKCQFCLPKLTFYGHDLSSQGVSPSEECESSRCDRGQIICSTPSAKSITNFAQEAEPLRHLLRRNEPFVRGESQQRSFQKLKDLLAQAITLAYFGGDCKLFLAPKLFKLIVF